MNDFSIRIKGMPLDHQYANNENNLRAFLAYHLEGIVKDGMATKGEVQSPEFDDIAAGGKGLTSYAWEIADINFGQTNMGYVEYLNKLADLRTKYIVNQHKLAKTHDMKQEGQIEMEQAMLQEKWKVVLD
jgi:hypothetical protein